MPDWFAPMLNDARRNEAYRHAIDHCFTTTFAATSASTSAATSASSAATSANLPELLIVDMGAGAGVPSLSPAYLH